MSDWSSDVCSSDLDQLSSDLRDQILAAAQELGYVGPDPAARALARGTAGAVGVLLTDSLRYAFTDEVATGFLGARSEERRVGKEGVRPCRSRWSPVHETKNTNTSQNDDDTF